MSGASATEETEVLVAYDEDHVYFGFHVRYEDPSIMRASRVDRDRAASDDLVTVYLDPFLDQQRAYRFDLNAYGVQGDGIISASVNSLRGGQGGSASIPQVDRSWDALFDSGAQIVSDGYTAELAIPLKSLRYPRRADDEVHRWGLQVVREIRGKDEETLVWAPMSRDQSSFYSQMGLLEGMTGLSTSRNLEVLPTVTVTQHGETESQGAGGPSFVNQDADPDAGVSLKYGVTSNLVVDLTINPDFSQIELDRPQIEVNQRFPLFFQELRPFFVEGSEIFAVSAPVTVVHTRTIVDPDYGAKLSGKVGRVSVGVLAANDAAPGRVDDPADPAFQHEAQSYVARGKLEVWSESYVGGIATDREFMNGYSRLAGVDGSLRLGPRRTLTFNLLGTRNRDGEGVRRNGYLTDAMVRHQGRNLDFYAQWFQVSPDFETANGFVRRRDQRQLDSRIAYTFWPEGWLLSSWHGLRYYRNYDFNGTLQEALLRTGLDLTFARNVNVHANLERMTERYEGIDFDKPRLSVSADVRTSQMLSFGGNFAKGKQIRFAEDPFLGDEVVWGLDATIRPSPRLTSSMSVESSRLTDPRNSGSEVFHVRIFGARSTLQFGDRLQLRNITQYDTDAGVFDVNVLVTYRVNAGTAFHVGYDDHYTEADRITGDPDGDGAEEPLFAGDYLRRTRRTLFAKFQYLLRL